MRTILTGILFLAAMSGAAQAQPLTRVGFVTHAAKPVYQARGNVGTFEVKIDLARVVRETSGVTIATLQGTRVDGSGIVAREDTTILIVCARGTLSIDRVDYLDAGGAKLGRATVAAYDAITPKPDTMMSGVLDLICPAQ